MSEVVKIAFRNGMATIDSVLQSVTRNAGLWRAEFLLQTLTKRVHFRFAKLPEAIVMPVPMSKP
jgi:hypothetical protein